MEGNSADVVPEEVQAPSAFDDENVETLFSIVKAKTGHDFRAYKRETVVRRIERRLAMNGIKELPAYIGLLRESMEEAVALSHEILIGVTSFFRDPEAYELLRQEIRQQLTDSDGSVPFRIWDACCSTGEEVYSLAILLNEELDRLPFDRKIQIFATDLDPNSIVRARAGLYPDSVAEQIGEARLARYFTKGPDGWHASKQLREKIVFAQHDVLKDPPFSRLDMVVCRNFLIYLKPYMQKQLMLLFHQVLKPNGILFLGNSESTGSHSDLFVTISKKWKIYRRIETGRRWEMLFHLTPSVPTPQLAYRGTPRNLRYEPSPAAAYEKQLVERHAPPAIVVDDRYELVYNSTPENRYLRMPAGCVTRDVLRMVCTELRAPLRAAVHKTLAEGEVVVFRGLQCRSLGDTEGVDLVVEPVTAEGGRRLAMIVFLRSTLPVGPLTPADSPENIPADESAKDLLIRQMEEQLRITHEQLVSTVEQLETSNDGLMSTNEELMSINEEFQSTNEELQSTNEELETSKEELQALNEELATVNAELQEKVEELNASNADLQNILNSTQIATIFLDRQLHIKRFTPAMAALFGLINPDVGRPFRHICGGLSWDVITEDASAVLETLVPVEREIDNRQSGRQYLLRVMPYRTTDGGVDGVVLTFIDITERKRSEEAIRNQAHLLDMSYDAILTWTLDGTIRYWNGGAQRLYGYTAEEAVGQVSHDLLATAAPEGIATILNSLRRDGAWGGELHHRTAEGSDIIVESRMQLIVNGDGGSTVLETNRDITQRKLAEENLRQEAERRRLALEAGELGSWTYDLHSGEVFWDERCRDMFGASDLSIGYESAIGTLHPDDVAPTDAAVRAVIAGENDGRYHREFRVVWPDGSIHWIESYGRVWFEGEGEGRRAIRFSGVNIDVTERKRAEERLDFLSTAAERLLRAKAPLDILDELAAQVMKLTGCDLFFNYVSDSTAGKLRLNAAGGIAAEDLHSLQWLEYGAAVCGAVASDGFRIIAEDILAGEDPRTTLIRTLGVSSYACLPLIVKGGVAGTLSFGSKSRTTFADDDISFIRTFAEQVAAAMARSEAETALRVANEQVLQERNMLKAVMASLPVGLSIVDTAGGVIEVNDGFHHVWGGTPPPTTSVEDYNRYRGWWPETGALLKPEEWGSARAINGERVTGQVVAIERFDGTIGHVHNNAAPILDETGAVTGAVVAIMDITELKRAEDRIRHQNSILSGIGRIFSALLEADSDEVLGQACLAVAEEVTGSRFGFIGETGADGLLHDIALSDPGWDLCTMYDPSGTRRPPGDFHLHGLYGKTILDGKGYFTNAPSSHPASVGTPEGHPPIESFLGVPLVREGEVTGMIAVANRKGGYREQDLQALEALAPAVVEAFLRLRAETALRKAKGTLEETVASRTADLAATVQRLTKEMEQRREAEEIVRRNEALLRTVLEALPVGIAIVDTEGMVTYLNDAAKHLWGDERLVSRDPYQDYIVWEHDTDTPVPPEQRPAHLVLASGEAVIGHMVDIQTMEGNRRTIIASAVPIRNEVGAITGAVSVMEDITKQNELQKQLYHSQRLESVGSLAGGIAHDFNNLLMGIAGFAQIVYDELPDGEQKQSLAQVLAASVKARDLTGKLLTFSRQQMIEMKPVNLSEVTAGVVKFLERVIPESTAVEAQIRDGICVTGDGSQLEQVLTNIIINASDAMPAGGRLRVEAGMHEGEGPSGCATSGRWAFVKISDTGSGIPTADLDRIFEPFFTTKETGKGTGLGLSIAYGIARQHGGSITVESRQGEGSTFIVWMPALNAAVQTTEPPSATPQRDGAGTVLVVEDDPVLRDYLKAVLARSGYKVHLAEDGEDGLAVVAAHPVDLVITDVIMPRMSGMDMFARLRETHPGMKVIFMSGYAPDVVPGEMARQAAAFLQKPVLRETLLATVREVLAGTSAPFSV